MPKRTIANLGTMVRKKRGALKLRETAKDIGIGPATLMRVEAGRVPDLATYAKICDWLKVDPGTFLGFDPSASTQESTKPEQRAPLLVSAHFRADRTPKPETVNALAKMILLAVRHQRGTEEIPDDDDA
jgi:transcriptional regulator with XRE-family HTH domain